jgi:hypothetical protein
MCRLRTTPAYDLKDMANGDDGNYTLERGGFLRVRVNEKETISEATY